MKVKQRHRERECIAFGHETCYLSIDNDLKRNLLRVKRLDVIII